VTYPSGIVITNLYNSDGYLSEIKNSGSSIWKLDEINSSGQPEQYSLGSSGLKTNFEYDTKGFLNKKTTGQGVQFFDFNANTGNLDSRGYKKTSDTDTLTEVFTYDEMNRLYTSQVEDEDNYTINYTSNGNISYKTDAGSYSYHSSQKNAVIGISNNPGTIISADTVDFTASNMTSSVYEWPYQVDYVYGVNDMRLKSIFKYKHTVQETKYYSGSYEKEVTGAGEKHLHYINCPYGLVAVLIKEGETTTLYYTETDHLGSIIGLMNSSGTYQEQFSFDPWGRRRNPADWTFNNVPNPALLDRGFTGHEHLDKLGLINMNGRMYDPILGRLLGVDPVIQMPDNSQSFNGYSYCLNNPLKYTDPSGYEYDKFLRDWERDQRDNPGADQLFNNYVDYWGQIQDAFAIMHTYEEVEKNKDDKKKKNKEEEYVLVYIPGPYGVSIPVFMPATHTKDGNVNPINLSKGDKETILTIAWVFAGVSALAEGDVNIFVRRVFMGPSILMAGINLIDSYSLLSSPDWGDKYHYGMMVFFAGISFTEIGAPISLGYFTLDHFKLLEGQYEKANFLQHTGYWPLSTPTCPFIPIHVFNINIK
jgi:RHS repeat-associated protein